MRTCLKGPVQSEEHVKFINICIKQTAIKTKGEIESATFFPQEQNAIIKAVDDNINKKGVKRVCAWQDE